MHLTIAGRYRLDAVLGRGSMGEVYRARDLQLDRSVAVKVVRADRVRGGAAAERFRRDAQAAARLAHPSIVSILDFGTPADGGAYLVMDLVRGEDLRRALLRERRLDPARAVAILSNVCAGVEAAHRQGVLHRDLKPENILLPESDVAATVLDFGMGDELIEGTPAYMSPEQLRGERPDGRTDVFSLGVIAYEMLSGRLPFGRGSFGEVALAQARGVRPLHQTDGIPSGVERAVRAALDADVDRRPASPQAFGHLVSAGMQL
jgi:serine/threonine protein kinase